MSELEREIVLIFTIAQESYSSHAKCMCRLKKLYENNDLDTFCQATEKITGVLLVQPFKHLNPFIDKSISFFVTFSTTIDFIPENNEEDSFDVPPFLNKIFEYLIEKHDLDMEIIRYRTCQIINKFLDNMKGFNISAELCDKIQEAMLERMSDSKQHIRLQAILAIYRLQDSSDIIDPVINAFISHMAADSSAKVRKACVEKIALRKDVIPHIIERTRDVIDDVRLAALTRISKIPNLIKVIYRQQVIKIGFCDSSARIKRFMKTTLIPSWLGYYKNSYCNLLKAVRLDSSQSDIKQSSLVMELIMKALLETQSHEELLNALTMTQHHVIEYEKLNWETSIYWRCLVTYMRGNDEYEDALNEIVPDLVEFCPYIRGYCKLQPSRDNYIDFAQFQFILKQLFLIASEYDVSDVVSRQELCNLVSDVLQNQILNIDVIKSLINTLSKTHPNTEARSQFVCKIISDIMYPLSTETHEARDYQFMLAQLDVKKNVLKEEQLVAVKNQDFEAADRYKKEIQDIQDQIKKAEAEKDVAIVVKQTDNIWDIKKYLNIAIVLLSLPEIIELTPTLLSLKVNVIDELILHPNVTIKLKALKCYGLCCIINQDCAEIGIVIFIGLITMYTKHGEGDLEILKLAIGSVSDIIVIYGLSIVKNLSDDVKDNLTYLANTVPTDIIFKDLPDLMDNELIEIQECAVHALYNLIITRELQSPQLISKMILKWCNPVTAEPEFLRLQQLIGRMLERLPTLKYSSRELEGAVLPTLKTIILAPRNSPLAQVDVDRTAKFLLNLCSCCVEVNIHDHLITLICSELQNEPNTKINVFYSKLLMMLQLRKEDKAHLEKLSSICETIKETIKDEPVLNNLDKFMRRLKTAEEACRSSS